MRHFATSGTARPIHLELGYRVQVMYITLSYERSSASAAALSSCSLAFIFGLEAAVSIESLDRAVRDAYTSKSFASRASFSC